MKIVKPLCPECGEKAKGTVDYIPGCIAQFGTVNDDGETEYGGYTEVNWDGQMSVTNKHGECLLICRDGHQWYSQIDFSFDGTTG